MISNTEITWNQLGLSENQVPHSIGFASHFPWDWRGCYVFSFHINQVQPAILRYQNPTSPLELQVTAVVGVEDPCGAQTRLLQHHVPQLSGPWTSMRRAQKSPHVMENLGDWILEILEPPSLGIIEQHIIGDFWHEPIFGSFIIYTVYTIYNLFLVYGFQKALHRTKWHSTPGSSYSADAFFRK